MVQCCVVAKVVFSSLRIFGIQLFLLLEIISFNIDNRILDTCHVDAWQPGREVEPRRSPSAS